MIKQLYNELIKNIKMMFRNWTALSLLIIVPIIMILLIGYAFSNEDVSEIKIGIISDQTTDIHSLTGNVSNYAELIQYATKENCISDLVKQDIHLCVELEGVNLNRSQITSLDTVPTGKIAYYYDNSRKKISLAIIQKMQDFFGVKSEQISIEAAAGIIERIQNLVAFINDRKIDIDNIRNESNKIRADLIERKQKLIEVRDDFMPSYLAVKDIQAQLHNYSEDFNNTAMQLSKSISSTSSAINLYNNISNSTLDLNLTNISLPENLTNISSINISNITTNISSIVEIIQNATNTINETIAAIASNASAISQTTSLSLINQQLIAISNLTNTTADKVNQIIVSVDDVVEKLDQINITLNEEIQRSDEYILKIDESAKSINNLSRELDSKMSQLSKLSPDSAEKLVKPITYEYSTLLTGLKNIQLSFPSLLSIILMFIALLFANIIVLMEINDKAYLRNLVAPVNDSIFMLGLIITGTTIICFQIFVLLLVAQTKFAIPVTKIFWPLLLILILLILIYVLLGMIFAYLTRNVQTSILITTFFVLTLFMFSNAIAPIESMPAAAKFVSQHNPLVVGEFLIREVQLFHMPLSYLLPQLLLLAGYVVVLFFAAFILMKQANKKR